MFSSKYLGSLSMTLKFFHNLRNINKNTLINKKLELIYWQMKKEVDNVFLKLFLIHHQEYLQNVILQIDF